MSPASVENVAALPSLPSLPSPLKDLTSGLTVATGEEGPKKILEELPYMTYAIFFDTLPLVGTEFLLKIEATSIIWYAIP